MSKRRNAEDDDSVKFVALGGGSEVGRSCHILKYKGKTIMLDAGVHPAYSGVASLPFYDDYDLSEVDILLISHFHLDHAASLPYVMQRTGFKGRVFMTHPTKAIYRWLLSDFVRVSSGPADEGNSELYTDEDLNESFNKIEAIDFYSTMEVSGIRFTAYHAGHVLGAAMYLIEISGLKVLFTGDYSREEDRHLHIAEVPPERPDVLICESTFGTGMLQPRVEKEAKLLSLIHSTIRRGGRCLLPVFALGGTQELLLILEEYWNNHPDLDGVHIYYASTLARKCMAVYQTFINMMNDNIRRKFAATKTNPFKFKHITSLRSLDRFDDVGPCVMLASPGMLQNGVSRQLLERWAPDPRNSLIITGYSVEGTMAKHIITEPVDISSNNNPDMRIPRRISVDEISFAAHVDFRQNSEFIDLVGASHVILVHGETTNMGRLKSALLSKYAKQKGTHEEVKVYNPRNCVDVSIPFQSQKMAKTVGSLASKDPKPGDYVSGLLVQDNRDFKLSLISASEASEYSELRPTTIMEKQSVVVDAAPSLVHYHLLNMFGDDLEEVNEHKWTIMKNIYVQFEGKNVYSVHWQADPESDMFADTVLAVLVGVDSSKASVKLTTKESHNHDHNHGHSQHENQEVAESENGVQGDESVGDIAGDVTGDVTGDITGDITVDESRGSNREEQLRSLLIPHFGDSFTFDKDRDTAVVAIDGNQATINFEDMSVTSTNPTLEQRVLHVLKLCASIVDPLSGERRDGKPRVTQASS